MARQHGAARRRRRPIAPCVCRVVLTAALALPAAAQDQPLPCQRWAHMTTIASSSTNSTSSSTLWIYGGQARTSPSQQDNTWTNALLSLDLSKGWNAGAPALTLVQPDNGNPYDPPAVSLGSLWSSGDDLYLANGQFSDSPYVRPGAMGLVQYSISGNSWQNSTATGQGNIVRVSEGAGALVPTGSNVGYYFGGHIDWSSVQGWSTETPRVFLNSLAQLDLGTLTWTNYSSYSDTGTIGTGNETTESAPTSRADSTLTYVPTLGTGGKGILVSIGGGVNYVSNSQNTNRSIDMAALDVFDIASNSWSRQATQGDIPSPRVNHCAVRGSAKIHGTEHHQIFIYGGQIVNGTAQSTDLYVLCLPSFTWTNGGTNASVSAPSGRAGHTCDLVGSQMLVVGGFISSDLLCDSQPVYVLDTKTLTWQNHYTPGSLYQTPYAVEAVNGGIGAGTSTSGSGSTIGGDGSQDPDVSASLSGTGSSGGAINPDQGGGSSSSKAGPIAGGVVGGIVAVLLILLALFLWRRRQWRRRRSQTEAAAAAEKASLRRHEASKSLSSQGRHPDLQWRDSDGMGTSDDTAHDRFPLYPPMSASDDPETDTRDYEAQFSTRLAPRQQLRIVNPDA